MSAAVQQPKHLRPDLLPLSSCQTQGRLQNLDISSCTFSKLKRGQLLLARSPASMTGNADQVQIAFSCTELVQRTANQQNSGHLPAFASSPCLCEHAANGRR